MSYVIAAFGITIVTLGVYGGILLRDRARLESDDG